MDLARLQALIELVGRAGLAELDLREGGTRVRIKAARRPAVAGAPAVRASAVVPERDGTGEPADAPSIVRAPLSGTFFAAPSPSAPPFHRVGDRVGEDSTLCIIEAMKTMTHVPSGHAGVLRSVLVETGAAVEFGQPLFEIA